MLLGLNVIITGFIIFRNYCLLIFFFHVPGRWSSDSSSNVEFSLVSSSFLLSFIIALPWRIQEIAELKRTTDGWVRKGVCVEKGRKEDVFVFVEKQNKTRIRSIALELGSSLFLWLNCRMSVQVSKWS